MATQPSPAIPPFEPPPLPLSVTDSARRILWIVALYRAVCGAVLLGMALLFDLRILSVAAPNAFLTMLWVAEAKEVWIRVLGAVVMIVG